MSLELIHLVQLLPGELHVSPAEVTVSRSLLVNRTAEVKHFDNAGRSQVKMFPDDLCQLLITKFAGSECLDHNGGGLSHTNRIGQLDLNLVCKPGRNQVLRDITGCISAGAVHFGAVLAGESSATVPCISAICIHNSLASLEAGIAMRTSDDKTTGRIYEKLGLIINQLGRNNGFKHIFADILMDLFLAYARIMLC